MARASWLLGVHGKFQNCKPYSISKKKTIQQPKTILKVAIKFLEILRVTMLSIQTWLRRLSFTILVGVHLELLIQVRLLHSCNAIHQQADILPQGLGKFWGDLQGFLNSWLKYVVPSLKLAIAPARLRHPKGNDRLPTIQFLDAMLASGRASSTIQPIQDPWYEGFRMMRLILKAVKSHSSALAWFPGAGKNPGQNKRKLNSTWHNSSPLATFFPWRKAT